MENGQARFTGLFVPLVTPFGESGEPDPASLEQLASHLAAQGIAGLVSCARIGEGPVLTRQEKLAVFEIVGKVSRRERLAHIAAIMPQSTDEAIAMCRELEALPVDAAMIFPPLLFAWGKVESELKVRFFEDLARGSRMPLVLFQVPVRSYWYDVETVCRIAELERVVAYKEASFNVELFADTMRELKQRKAAMQVLTGNDRFVAQCYRHSAEGALIGISNVATKQWAAIDAAARRGEHERAVALQDQMRDLQELIFGEPIVEAVARIKAVLQHQGLIRWAGVRRPQLGVSSEHREKLIRSFREIAGKEAPAGKETGLDTRLH
jgi:4-hydroxy-tetrahydrodipicolinate synthase